MGKLLAAGHEVFAVSRSPDKIAKKERLHAVRIDSQKPAEGLEVLEKVDAAFLIVPPTVVDGYSVLNPFVEKAKAVKLSKLVLMTAMGVNYAPPEAPLRKLELTVEASGLQYNILRPNWFMQNFHTFWIRGILKDQKIYFPGGNAKASFIDARDISAVASELLTSNKFANQAFDLTGGEALTHDEVATKISKATGKKIEYADITSEAFQQALSVVGLPADYVGFLAHIASILKSGGAAPVSNSVHAITGKSPITFDEYANDFKAKWGDRLSKSKQEIADRYFHPFYNTKAIAAVAKIIDEIVADDFIDSSPIFDSTPDKAGFTRSVGMIQTAFDQKYEVKELIQEGDLYVGRWEAEGLPADTHYAFGMLGARFIAYGLGMFVIARNPEKNLFWIKDMILIQLVDLSVGVFYTASGVVLLSSSALPMFDATLIATLLFFWMPKQVHNQEK